MITLLQSIPQIYFWFLNNIKFKLFLILSYEDYKND